MLSFVRLFVIPWTAAARLLCSWNSPGKNTGVGSHSLLQGIFLTQTWIEPRSCKQILYPLSYQGSQPAGKPKKTEHQRTDAFKLWCWRRLLRVSWTARRSHQSILKEINPEYSSEGLLLNPKLQYFGHMVGKANSLEKTLMLRKTEGKRRGGDREYDGR